jgi:isatin hydrolase
VPTRGAWFCFLPIKIEGGTGAPGRAIALVPPDRQH